MSAMAQEGEAARRTRSRRSSAAAQVFRGVLARLSVGRWARGSQHPGLQTFAVGDCIDTCTTMPLYKDAHSDAERCKVSSGTRLLVIDIDVGSPRHYKVLCGMTVGWIRLAPDPDDDLGMIMRHVSSVSTMSTRESLEERLRDMRDEIRLRYRSPFKPLRKAFRRLRGGIGRLRKRLLAKELAARRSPQELAAPQGHDGSSSYALSSGQSSWQGRGSAGSSYELPYQIDRTGSNDSQGSSCGKHEAVAYWSSRSLSSGSLFSCKSFHQDDSYGQKHGASRDKAMMLPAEEPLSLATSTAPLLRGWPKVLATFLCCRL
mmetsp:Transcript_86792/g.193214  ORF Transcript_86792/g.193214 Transcript_86792/m.193214 type:complete len:317 (-) Transcript_86792:142-1092(-)